MGPLLSLFAKYAARASLFVFASLLAVTPALADNLVNRWTGEKLGAQGSAAVLQASTAETNWVVEASDDGFVLLKDGKSGLYLNVETGALAVSAIQPGWWSAQWTLEDAGDGYVRIKNRWKGTYLHNESKSLAAGAMQPGWWSAQWKRERYFPETYRSPTAGRATKVRTFDQYAWLTAHNAFLNYTDARWTFPNQSRGIIGQLTSNGVRGLQLDVYDFKGKSDARGAVACGVTLSGDCYPAGVYMCHGDCVSIAGANYAFPRQNLKDTLDAIGDWLTANTDEKDIITIFFEDYTADGTLAAVIRSSRAAPFIFNPNDSQWSVKSKGWPTLSAMKSAGKRLILFTSKAANADSGLGLSHDQSFNVENYWSLGDLGTDTTCRTRWDSIPLDTDGGAFKRLFLMNHYRNVPTTGLSAEDNALNSLQSRLILCQKVAQRLPNFVALDFVELGGAGDFIVDLNGKWVEAVNE